MTRRILGIVLAFAAFPLVGRGVYTYERVVSLSNSQEKVTIHLATGAPYTVGFIAATLRSSVAGQFELLRDGTAPTTTAVTPSELNGGATGVARAYHTSNVGSGTHIKYYDLAAGVELPLEMGQMGLTAGRNITFQSPASFTSDVRIFLQWREE